MSRNIEGRLAKLEARAGTGKRGLVFAMNKPGETKEEFDRRVDRLIAESVERDGCEPIVFRLYIGPNLPNEVIDGERQLEAGSSPAELPALSSTPANGRGYE